MNAYAQQDRDYDKAITQAHQDEETIEYIEYQAEMIISYIADKRLCTDHLMDKIESCVQQITESIEAIR
jgi:hypothetical protein